MGYRLYFDIQKSNSSFGSTFFRTEDTRLSPM